VLCVALGWGCYAAPAEDKAAPAGTIAPAASGVGRPETESVDQGLVEPGDPRRRGSEGSKGEKQEFGQAPRPVEPTVPGSPDPEGLPTDGRRPPRAAVELPPNAKLDAFELQRAIDGRFGKLALCIREDTTAKVSLKVASSGELIQVKVLSSTPDSPLLRDCVAAALSGTRVASSRGSDDKPVVMTLALRKGG
jgi:hypothetical protein